MQRIRWCRWLAVGALVAPSAGRAQAPRPKIREIATIPGVDVWDLVRLPNGRVVLYTVGDSVVAYDLTTKRKTLVTRDWFDVIRLSPAGDRIAYGHRGEDGRGEWIWSMPIDPSTGAAAGPAQRVTTIQGDYPSFSPDGKLIAFNTNPMGGGGSDLWVVAATGGSERIIAKFGLGMKSTSWSADGKWIFAEVMRGTSHSIERVPAAGGRSETLISYTRRGAILGGWIDGRLFFYRPAFRSQEEGRLAYVTAAGTHGEFMIPPGTRSNDEAWSARTLLIKNTRPSTAQILNLADGKVRDLLAGTLESRAPVWSPDGSRIALQTGTGGNWQITVVNADGSRPRTYPVRVDPTGVQSMRWSPNGEMLAYRAAEARAIAVLDLGTGTTQVVSSAPATGEFQDFVWRADGLSLVLAKRSLQSGDSPREVYETTTDGRERKLRDMGPEVPESYWDVFLTDRLLYEATASGPSVMSSSSGPSQKLPGSGRRNPWPGVSSDGKSLLLLVPNDDKGLTDIDLMDSGGDSLRTLSLPFEVTCCWNAPFHPDGRHLILGGTTPGESISKLFLVPLNGDAPRVLSQFSPLNGAAYVSPDGRSLVFTSEGTPTSTIYELDVTPILQSIGKH